MAAGVSELFYGVGNFLSNLFWQIKLRELFLVDCQLVLGGKRFDVFGVEQYFDGMIKAFLCCDREGRFITVVFNGDINIGVEGEEANDGDSIFACFVVGVGVEKDFFSEVHDKGVETHDRKNKGGVFTFTKAGIDVGPFGYTLADSCDVCSGYRFKKELVKAIEFRLGVDPRTRRCQGEKKNGF